MYARPAPSTASPANSEQTNPSRTNNSRDRAGAALPTQGSGSSDDFVTGRQEQPMAVDSTASTARLNQVIQNFHTKAALIVLRSRIELSPAYSTKTNEVRVNKWFNIELDETEDYLEDIRIWKKCDVKDARPPPLVIEFYLTTEPLRQDQRLVILDEDQKRWDVYNALDSLENTTPTNSRPADTHQLILERWTIELGDSRALIPSDLAAVLPLVYKKSIVLFRSLYTYCNFMPTWKLIKKLGRTRSTSGLKVGYRIADGSRLDSLSRHDNLAVPLYGNASDVLDEYDFGSTDSPAGPFSIKVQFRHNCDFRIDDSEELLSSNFIGDDMFQPSMRREAPADDSQRVGSLPNDKRKNLMERPELGHAYGSLSTFHQAGISPGTSPISALRAAKELGSESPEEQTRTQAANLAQQRTSAASKPTPMARRSTLSFQPFKAPVLSASPYSSSPLAGSPRLSSRVVQNLGSLTEENAIPVPQKTASRQRSSDPTSTSPKSVPVQRFSSSFSHRRNRLSVDRAASKAEDDQSSSGRQSAASSAQPVSALAVEVAQGEGSSGSMQEDDEKISDFLKMLDQRKDLLRPASSAAVETAARQTAAALNRFQKMRDSNAALSDSMSSSLMVQKPAASNKSSPGPSTGASPAKAVSPHTPHTPFAPSRLSAAYSHDDMQDHQEEPSIPTELEELTQTATNLSPIAIPASPMPFNENYRRSSSARRQPLPSDDEIGDLYGMRSASMGAQAKGLPLEREKPSGGDGKEQHPLRPRTSAGDGHISDSGSARSSGYVYNSHYTRGGVAVRGKPASPLQGSTSSFGAGGGSMDRADSVSASGSWGGRVGRHNLTMTKPDVKSDEDEFLPFAMEASSISPGTKPGAR